MKRKKRVRKDRESKEESPMGEWEITLPERIFLFFLFLTLLVGIGHAYPLTNVIGDESPFVGGVLRSLSTGSMIPTIDYSYTVSFYVNYFAMGILAAIIFPFAGFSVDGVKETLLASYHLLPLVPRAVTLVSTLLTAYLLLLLSRQSGQELRARLLIQGVFFSTIIVAVISHTGKMWGLSLLLLMSALFFTSRAFRDATPFNGPMYRSSIFWSIGFAFLAFANFPIAVIQLAVIPFLFYHFRSSHPAIIRIFSATIFWTFIFGVLLFLNMDGWMTQNSITAPQDMAPSFMANILHYGIGLFVFCPFLLALFLVGSRRTEKSPLFFLVITEFLAYVLLVSYRAPWAAGSDAYDRYFFPIALFLTLLATLRRRVSGNGAVVILVLSLIFFIKTLVLLSLPTTYNIARDIIIRDLSRDDVVVLVSLDKLDLPKSARAYELTQEGRCGSLCRSIREKGDSGSLTYTVIDEDTDEEKKGAILQDAARVYFATERILPDVSPLYKIDNGSRETYEVEWKMGTYDPRYLLTGRLGPVIYVYSLDKGEIVKYLL